MRGVRAASHPTGDAWNANVGAGLVMMSLEPGGGSIGSSC